jgi:hypothetical protein
MLQSTVAWAPPTNDYSLGVAWGDINGDGILDLALGNQNQPSKVYLNQGGMLQSTPAWSAPASDNTAGIAWGDMNGDGALDLALGNLGQPSKVYLHPLPVHPSNARSPEALMLRHTNDPANFYAKSAILQSGRIPLPYQLFHPGSEPMREVRVYYSLDGSFPSDRGKWRVAVPTLDTITTDLTTSPYPTPTITNTHVFTWNVFESGFFGQSDNVVIRIEALFLDRSNVHLSQRRRFPFACEAHRCRW